MCDMENRKQHLVEALKFTQNKFSLGSHFFNKLLLIILPLPLVLRVQWLTGLGGLCDGFGHLT